MADEQPKPPKLLIVDDEPEVMRALCETLAGHGYETVGATSGEEALAALRAGGFSLLLADLMMPQMNGITLLRAAAAHDSHLMGIIMTGEGSIASAVEAMKSGALDYILKPFRLSTILPVLSRALMVRQLRIDNGELQSGLRQRTGELEAVNKELDAFAGTVSHDLRAPLNAANSLLGHVLHDYAGQMPAEAQRLLEVVRKSGDRLERLTDDLLHFARLGRQPLSKERVNLRTMVDNVLRELRTEINGRQLEISIGELPDCEADPALLKQALTNLLSNACKFTRYRNTPRIDVGCRAQTGQTVYYIRDNGAGFDMTHATRLFDIFQRYHSAEDFEGSGVGLSIADRIIRRHGGHIWAEAQVDRGATFFFTL